MLNYCKDVIKIRIRRIIKVISFFSEGKRLIIQSVVLLILIGGVVLTVKGHLVQHHAYARLGDSLPAKKFTEAEGENLLTIEEENLFLSSLSGLRMKIIGAILIAIPSSILILFHLN